MMVHGKFGPPQDMAFIPAFLISGVLYLETHPSLVAEFGLTVPPPKKRHDPPKGAVCAKAKATHCDMQIHIEHSIDLNTREWTEQNTNS